MAKTKIVYPKVSSYFEDQVAGERVDKILSTISNDISRILSSDAAAFSAHLTNFSNPHQVNASQLASGNLAYARLPTGGGTWANGGALSITGGVTTVAGLLIAASGTSPDLKIVHPLGASNTHAIEIWSDSGSDVDARMIFRYDGHIVWGPGNAIHDVRLKRTMVGQVEIHGQTLNSAALNIQGVLGVGLVEGTVPGAGLDVQYAGVNATMRVWQTNGGGSFFIRRVDSTPTAGDNLFSWEIEGNDSGGTYDRYAFIRTFTPNITAGSRTGTWEFATIASGSEAVRFEIKGADVGIRAAARQYFDLSGASGLTVFGNTYRTESAADQLDDVVGGNTMLRLTATQIGVFNVGPQARPAAYTQAYVTVSRIHADLVSGDLTGLTSSTTGTALTEPSAAYTQSEMQQNFRRIQDQFNNLRADVANAKQVLNQVIDDLQGYGWLQ